jgi:DNA-binding transcriptional MerR regulator
MKERTKLRSGMSREEIERYLDEQDELEMEEIKIRKQKTYSDREEMLNEM